MKVTEHPAGNFCWADLTTSDTDAAKAFYTSLFGWTYQDNPMGPDEVYTMLLKDNSPAAALFKGAPEQGPPHWGSYVCTRSADETANRVRAAGGTIIMEPFDVMEHGRMCVIQDPTGAFISAWQPNQHIGYTVIDEDSAVCYNELHTRGADKAKVFYQEAFGWTPKDSEMGGGYIEFSNGDKVVAGLMEMTPDMGPVPPHWQIYIQVPSTEAATKKAQSLGANVIVPPSDIPDMGRFAILQDPQGAVFGVYSPAA